MSIAKVGASMVGQAVKNKVSALDTWRKRMKTKLLQNISQQEGDLEITDEKVKQRSARDAQMILADQQTIDQNLIQLDDIDEQIQIESQRIGEDYTSDELEALLTRRQALLDSINKSKTRLEAKQESLTKQRTQLQERLDDLKNRISRGQLTEEEQQNVAEDLQELERRLQEEDLTDEERADLADEAADLQEALQDSNSIDRLENARDSLTDSLEKLDQRIEDLQDMAARRANFLNRVNYVPTVEEEDTMRPLFEAGQEEDQYFMEEEDMGPEEEIAPQEEEEEEAAPEEEQVAEEEEQATPIGKITEQDVPVPANILGKGNFIRITTAKMSNGKWQFGLSFKIGNLEVNFKLGTNDATFKTKAEAVKAATEEIIAKIALQTSMKARAITAWFNDQNKKAAKKEKEAAKTKKPETKNAESKKKEQKPSKPTTKPGKSAEYKDGVALMKNFIERIMPHKLPKRVGRSW